MREKENVRKPGRDLAGRDAAILSTQRVKQTGRI